MNLVPGYKISPLFALVLLSIFSLSSNAKDITIAVSKTPLSAPLIIAAENGFFKGEGLNINMKTVIGGHRAMNAVLNGEAELATTSDMVITNAIRSKQDVRVLATFVSSQKDLGIVIDKQSNIKSNADLQGKKIGATLNTASHFYVDTYLLLAGVPLDRVTLTNTAPEDMSNALSSHKVDAIATWEPWLSNTVEQSDKNARILRDVYAYTLTFNMVALESSNLSDSDVVSVLKALIKAEKFIADQPDEAMKLVAQFLDKELQQVKRLWPNYDYRMHLKDSLRLTIDSQIKWRDKLEKVDSEILGNLETFFRVKPLSLVDDGRVSLTF